MSKILAAIALAASLASPALADELVTNGNFEAGDTGFTSSYNTGGGPDANGNYYFNVGGDHTTGTGKYLNADSNSMADYFWSETFGVAANSDYTLSYWVKSINGGDSPLVRATVNGATVGVATSVPNSNWLQITNTFNSGADTSVTLRFFNDNHSYSYNDLGLDDVSVLGPAAVTDGAVPEPATWALMIAGFGMVGGAMRRRGAGAHAFA